MAHEADTDMGSIPPVRPAFRDALADELATRWDNESSGPRQRPPWRGRARWAAAAGIVTVAATAVALLSMTLPDDEAIRLAPAAVPTLPNGSLAGTVATARGDGVFGSPLSSIADTGGPVAIGVVPAGFRPVFVNDLGGGSETEQPAWFALALRFDGDRPTSDYVSVQIEAAVGDPYAGFQDQPLTATQIGPFEGRISPRIQGGAFFIAPIDATHRLIAQVSTGSPDDLAIVLAGLQLTTGNSSAAVTAWPAGYRQVSEGPTSGPFAEQQYSVAYARGQSHDSLIQVSALVRPSEPAYARMVLPGATAVEFMDGYAVDALNTFTYDVSPTLQVSVQRLADSADTEPDLLELARTIVAISPNEWDDLERQATDQPLRGNPALNSTVPPSPTTLPGDGGPATTGGVETTPASPCDGFANAYIGQGITTSLPPGSAADYGEATADPGPVHAGWAATFNVRNTTVTVGRRLGNEVVPEADLSQRIDGDVVTFVKSDNHLLRECVLHSTSYDRAMDEEDE